MGTLSGGGTAQITVGERCLLGANSGIGISLGDDCVVEAGLYVTASTPVLTPDGNVVKAIELSGRSGLMFIRDGQTGQVVVRQRTGVVGRIERRITRKRLSPFHVDSIIKPSTEGMVARSGGMLFVSTDSLFVRLGEGSGATMAFLMACGSTLSLSAVAIARPGGVEWLVNRWPQLRWPYCSSPCSALRHSFASSLR